MSGGPVFNSSGDLCGLICGGLSPEEANGEWTGYVSSLWPLMGTLLDLRIKGFPEGYCYPFRKLAQLGLVNVLNLDQIKVEIDSNQQVRVGLKKESPSEDGPSV